MRYFLDIAYKGTAYHGWQKQINAVSVQGVIEKSLQTLLALPDLETLGSGRTDTGVHATQQIVHFDVLVPLDTEKLLYKLNAILPPDIAAKDLQHVPDEAHARFDAIYRSYEYHILTHKSPFRRHEHYHFGRPLDIEAMNLAAQLLLQHQDFESFSKVKTEVNNFLCTITEAKWQTDGEGVLVFYITANRFLRGMVRAIVGTLLDVGTGKLNFSDFEHVIVSRNRQHAGKAVPPEGLFLVRVAYPPALWKEKTMRT